MRQWNSGRVGVVMFGLVMGTAYWVTTAKAAPPSDVSGMPFYASRYYDLYSDLDPKRVKEANLRMTRMAEEYYERTREFSGQIRTKFPFLLFGKAEDYYAAGGPPGSSGVFSSRGDQSRLMAISGSRNTDTTWYIIQHEGFHQFAHHVIGGGLPTWVNEGLAEYFAESVYTGDGFVTGLLPAHRVRRVQEAIGQKAMRPLVQMVFVTSRQWIMEMNHMNYDQAWSMVYFLAHGENGKYQTPFANFIKDLGRGQTQMKAWEVHFGSIEGFEQKWSQWWLALSPSATKDLYIKAAVATLTSFYGRAASHKQTFENFDALLQAGKDDKLKIPDNDDWLPPGLFKFGSSIVATVENEVQFELGKNRLVPQIVATQKDQTVITATYNPRSATGRVSVEIDDLGPVIETAKKLIEEKKPEEARRLLADRIRKLPKSPRIEEARKLVQSTFIKK